IQPVQVYLTIPTTRHGDIIPDRQVFRGPKSIDIVCLIEILAEESKACQRRFFVVKPKIKGIPDLFWHRVKGVAEIAKGKKTPVAHGGIAEEAVRPEVPTEPAVVRIVLVFEKQAVRRFINVEILELADHKSAR